MRRLLSVAFLSASCGVFYPNVAIAGPDEITNPFIKDTVSMLDWGVLRLQLRLDQNDGLRGSRVYFDWDANQIFVSKWEILNPSTTRINEAKDECTKFFETVRLSAGVRPVRGGTLSTLHSSFADLFSHAGFTRNVNGEDLETLLADLDRKFLIEYRRFLDPDINEGAYALECRGALLEAGFSVKELR